MPFPAKKKRNVETPTRAPCRSPCHVVYTDYRPTPLEHYVFPAGADEPYLVVDSRGTFRWVVGWL